MARVQVVPQLAPGFAPGDAHLQHHPFQGRVDGVGGLVLPAAQQVFVLGQQGIDSAQGGQVVNPCGIPGGLAPQLAHLHLPLAQAVVLAQGSLVVGVGGQSQGHHIAQPGGQALQVLHPPDELCQHFPRRTAARLGQHLPCLSGIPLQGGHVPGKGRAVESFI